MPDPVVEAATGMVARVSVRVPPFWQDDPGLWFAQIDSQFVLAGITQDITKFHTVTGALDQCYAAAVRDIIINPPAEGKYDRLKSELIRRFSPSLEARLEQLLQHEEMGDRSPSQFLSHMRVLGGTSVSDNVLRVLWLGRLPQRMHDILAASAPDNLEALAVIADRIYESATNLSRVAEVNDSDNLTSCQEQIEKLTRQVAALSTERSATTPRTRSANQQQAKSSAVRDAGQSTPEDEMCWFHRTFGENARRCRPPCNFPKKNYNGSR